jgi:hypothetical protein
MPYRHAHWYLLPLFPLVGVAFWPAYFSIFSTARAPLHAHAAAGTLWIAVLAAQSWLIHHDRRDIHRQVGITSLAAFPFFIATSAAVVVLMAQEFSSRSSPISAVYGPRLGLGSVVLVAGFAYCYWQGLRRRRKVHPHSRYMLSTALFLGPPIVVRLFRFVPYLQVRGPKEMGRFALDIQLGNGLVAAIALFLAWRASKHGRPFLEAAAIVALNLVLLPTVGMLSSWVQLFAHLSDIPLAVAATGGGIAGIIIAYSGWIAGKQQTPTAGALPA